MFGKLLRGGSVQPPPELPLTFRLGSERQLRIHQEYAPLSAWRFLSHHVRRYPQDLRAHTQRVLLAQQGSLRNCLAGSLQDVFIALESAGVQLRERLFHLVRDDLEEAEQIFFQQWLEADDGAAFRGRWHEGSLLSTGDGAEPLQLLHIQQSQESASYSSVMEEVLACLEYGQIEEAQELLEKEVLIAGNHDAALEQELLNVYQYTRNKEGVGAMISKMKESGREIPATWLEIQQVSEQW